MLGWVLSDGGELTACAKVGDSGGCAWVAAAGCYNAPTMSCLRSWAAEQRGRRCAAQETAMGQAFGGPVADRPRGAEPRV